MNGEMRSLPLQRAYRRFISHYVVDKHSSIGFVAWHQTRGILGTSNATAHRHVHQSVLRRIHPRHLYQIINDVDRYRDFLPYCHESKILQRSACGTMYDAVLGVGLPGPGPSSILEERYVSRVRAIAPADADSPIWTVEAKSIRSQLFYSLRSRWVLTYADAASDGELATEEESCHVNFEVEIRVSNPLVSLTLGQVLKDVARKQVEAFEKRCNEMPFVKFK
ncbi:hypothetical protein ACHAWF_018048 [Thalassiosira exigua]